MQTPMLNRAVCYANSHCVIAVHRRFWLGVSYVLQDALKYYAHLAIIEKSAELGFSCWPDNKVENQQIDMEHHIHLNCSPFLGIHPIKKCPHVQLWALASGK